MNSSQSGWTHLSPQYDSWSGGVLRSASFRTDCDVAIVGAGPYGLSAAAHMGAAGIKTRIFGEAMGFWKRHMPQGMRLRSPWRGNHIADPKGLLTLDRYAAESGFELEDPLPLAEFIGYGEWVQRTAAPHLDARNVTRVDADGPCFRLTLSDGDLLHARRVLLATGLANQEVRPPEFATLPAELASHSFDHSSLQKFCGKRVAVIGRGQTACEYGVLLHEAGAQVEIISRGGIYWTGLKRNGAIHEAMLRHLRPPSPIGPFPINWVIQKPGAFRRLPIDVRVRISEMSLRPTASAWLKPRAEAIQLTEGRSVKSFQVAGGRVCLRLDNGVTTTVDHVLLATGYRMDVTRQGMLSPDMLRRIHQIDGSPILNAGFESSVPGLHFAGSAAVHSFGPLMRSVYGAGPAARAVTVLAKQAVC